MTCSDAGFPRDSAVRSWKPRPWPWTCYKAAQTPIGKCWLTSVSHLGEELVIGGRRFCEGTWLSLAPAAADVCTCGNILLSLQASISHLLNKGMGLYDFSVQASRLHFPLKSTMKEDSIKPQSNNRFQEFGHSPQSQPRKLLLCLAGRQSPRGQPTAETPTLHSEIPNCSLFCFTQHILAQSQLIKYYAWEEKPSDKNLMPWKQVLETRPLYFEEPS